MTKVLMIGKFPPIQGGTSTAGYYTVRKLAESGHSVALVTDALTAGVEERCLFFGSDHRALLLSDYADAVSVRFCDLWQHTPKRSYDFSASFSMLITLALEEQKRMGCQVILSNYLEPYSLAGSYISSLFGVPHIIAHSGSDLFLFASDRRFSQAHIECLRSAKLVISQERCRQKLLDLGIPKIKVRTDVFMRTAWENFAPDGPELQLCELKNAIGLARTSGIPEWSIQNIDNFEELRRKRIVLGIYGKTDLRKDGAKGHFEILEALAKLSESQNAPLLMALIGNSGRQHFVEQIEAMGLTTSVILLPLLAPWNVNSFIRLCDVVTCLENNFWLAQHAPQLPFEIMSSGRCALVSRQVSQRFGAAGLNFTDNDFLEVAEPLTSGLINIFRSLTRERAREVGDNGWHAISRLKQAKERWSGAIGIEQLIAEVGAEQT